MRKSWEQNDRRAWVKSALNEPMPLSAPQKLGDFGEPVDMLAVRTGIPRRAWEIWLECKENSLSRTAKARFPNIWKKMLGKRKNQRAMSAVRRICKQVEDFFDSGGPASGYPKQQMLKPRDIVTGFFTPPLHWNFRPNAIRPSLRP